MERVKFKLSTTLILGNLIYLTSCAPIFEVYAPSVKGSDSNHIPRVKESPLPVVPHYAPEWSKRVPGTPVVTLS